MFCTLHHFINMKIVLFCTTLLFIQQCVLSCSVYEAGVNDQDKKIIVDKHNELRKQIANGKVDGQPRGVNLKRMEWDDYLAGQAQNIANSCVFEHQPVHDDRWGVGQNLLKSSSSAFDKGNDWSGVVESWFSEHTKYTYSAKYEFDKDTGHYTQVVWADTIRVGCGFTHYPNGNQYDKLYVCNYGPAGNVIGWTIYTVGDHGCEDLC